ncbi:MAG: NAD(P)-dependent alcohol dehydrogenase [Pseudolabrys sp.]|nr:NAD(P)-dependent alcohol dehydrogenase [Pseudolabrys sp.]
MQITAAVARAAFAPFTIETVDLDNPRDDELLVEVVASGMCQTDQHGRDGYFPTMKFPAVFGHEGAGIVRAVGRAVKEFRAGDHVMMAYPWCGHCANCRDHKPSYCLDVRELKMGGTRPDGSTIHSQNGKPVYGSFFQQSSFGTFTLAHERFAVKLRQDMPLDIACAFACGAQTGAGAVLNSLAAKTGESFVVFGAGAVGLSSLMAAKLAGCDPIIAVDVHEHRLKLARDLGATHTINHGGRADVVAEIKKLTGQGARYAIETSALPAVLREAIDVLMPAGTCILLGSARPGTESSFEMPFLQNGRSVRGVVQGDSVPKEFIPKLIDHFMAGRFPLDRTITYYALADINRAAKESNEGKTIKPVLRMPH